MFLDVRRDPGPLPSYSSVARVSFGEDLPFRAAPPVAAWFQALFTPLPGCFSAFPHGTKFTIGLGTYLALEVGAPQLPTAKPSHGTQEHPPSPPWVSPTGLSPSTAGLSSPLRLPRVGRTRGPTTPHSPRLFAWGFGLGSPPFGRPYSGDPKWFLFLPLLRCFRWGGSRSVLPLRVSRAPWVIPTAGGPIRRSPDRSLPAAPRGVSPLATAFLSARAEPSTRRLSAVYQCKPGLHTLCAALIFSHWYPNGSSRPSPGNTMVSGLHFKWR